MNCDYAKRTDEFHGWACAVSGGACMFVVPDSKRCAAVYGEGPDAVEPPEWEKFIKKRFERTE